MNRIYNLLNCPNNCLLFPCCYFYCCKMGNRKKEGLLAVVYFFILSCYFVKQKLLFIYINFFSIHSNFISFFPPHCWQVGDMNQNFSDIHIIWWQSFLSEERESGHNFMTKNVKNVRFKIKLWNIHSGLASTAGLH